MLYTIIGDPHCRPDNLAKIAQLFEIAEEMGNPVIILGDMFDTKEVIRGRCLNLVYSKLRYSKLRFTILVGNHDLYHLESDEHSLMVFESLKNVEIVRTWADLGHEDILLLGYQHDKNTIKQLLAEYGPGARTIFGHFELTAFDFGNGHICTDGMSSEDFGTARVISGHFHKFQQAGNVTYLGTPFSHSFGETDQEKYIGVFDTETHQMTLIATDFPQHRTISVDLTQNLPIRGFDPTDGHIYRIVLKGTQEQIDKYPQIPGVKRIEQVVDADTAADTQINETMTPESQFTTWAEQIKGYSQDIIALGLDILSKVK